MVSWWLTINCACVNYYAPRKQPSASSFAVAATGRLQLIKSIAMTLQQHIHDDNDGMVTNWGMGDPRQVFLHALTAAWVAAGLLAAIFIEMLHIPAGPLQFVIAFVTPCTGLIVYLLIWRRQYEPAAYVLCISVDVAFFVFYYLAHTQPASTTVGYIETRGLIIAMSGLGVIYAGAMLSRWAPVAFAAVNVAIFFLVIRPLLPQTEMRVGLPIFWGVLALSMWMFNTYLQRMISNLSAANLRRRAQMQQLSETTALLDLASDAIIVRDVHGVISFWNKGAESIYGFASTAALGKRFDDLVASDYMRPHREIEEHFLKYGHWDGELSQRTADGRTIWVASRWALRRDTTDGPAAILVITSEITERKSQQARLTFLSEHDLLTGLPNRALLVDRLGQAILRARRSGQPLAVMVADVDRFKSINSGLGHPVGDSVLQNVAKRLQATIGTDNTVAHLAGDTFGAIIENCGTAADICAIAEQLARHVAEPMEIQGHKLVITLSIGIALSTSDNESVGELVRDADTAMYAAKDAGRNGFRVFEHTLDRRHVRRTQLENALRQAIDNNELTLVYQPKVDIQSGRIHGVEVLLRWNSAEFGVVAPGDFIRLAEETGLISSIGLWVLHTACTQVRTWQLSGYDRLTVAVNLSARQFQQKDLVESIATILAAIEFPADRLELEITESAIMQDVDQTITVLEKLKRLGIRLAIDDFGTGYSSLNYLKRFPLHTLKIDQSFVRDLVQDPGDASIVAAVISLAKSLGLQVIAEGVETVEQLDYLRSLRCDEYQGFLFSRPVIASDLALMLAKHAQSSTRNLLEA